MLQTVHKVFGNKKATGFDEHRGLGAREPFWAKKKATGFECTRGLRFKRFSLPGNRRTPTRNHNTNAGVRQCVAHVDDWVTNFHLALFLISRSYFLRNLLTSWKSLAR